VSVREQTKAMKLFRAAKPPSSRNYGAWVAATYGVVGRIGIGNQLALTRETSLASVVRERRRRASRSARSRARRELRCGGGLPLKGVARGSC